MKKEARKPGSRGSGLSEGWLAFFLILPTAIVILCISVYPIFRTIWYSFFDLRLNHPTRNKTHFSYSLDLEQYCDALNSIQSQLKKAQNQVPEDDEKTSLDIQEMLTLLDNFHNSLFTRKDREELYTTVQDYYDRYEAIADENIKYLSISDNELKDYKAFCASLHSTASSFSDESLSASKALKKSVQAIDTFDFALVEPNYLGLGNYIRYLQNNRLWNSIANTMIFSFIAVAFETCVGLILALIMNQRFVGRGLVRASILIPWSIPASTSALIWRFMYDGQYGVIAKALAALGIISSPAVILTSRAGGLFGMILSDIWKTSPFMALLLLAGLQTIDTTLYEAARVDGSTPIKSFFHITLPLLKSSMLVAILFRTMDTVKAFDLANVMTYGANNTEFMSLYAYKLMFAQMDFGTGSTISIILFIIVFLICMFYIKVLGADLFKNVRT